MIRTIKIDVNAANPQLPLQPVSVFEGSAASLVLLNVPRSLGKRTITAVSVVVINPDSMAQAYEATREGSAYQVTIPAEAFGGSGSVENGIMVSASGTNERGETVGQWILGSGNLVVMHHNGTVKPGERRFAVHIYDAPPLHPVRGDMAPINGLYMLYNGIEWIGLGSGGSGSGAIVLRISDGKVFNGDVEITTFADLLAMVQAGGVTLLNTIGGNPKDALYYPHYCDETGIRFDATGILGSAVQTRSIVMHPKSGGGIIVTPGSLTELAKKTDLAGKVDKPVVFSARRWEGAEGFFVLTDENGNDVTRDKYNEITADESRDVFVSLLGFIFRRIGEYEYRTEIFANEGRISFFAGNVDLEWGNYVVFAPSAFRFNKILSDEEIKALVAANPSGGLTDSAKATLFSDTAFIEAVKKYGAPQYKKDEHGEWYQEVEI